MKHTSLLKKSLLIALVTIGTNAFSQTIPAIGTIPAGDSIIVVYDVTINSGVSSISSQGSISGSNFITLLTNDPKTVAAGDPTVTLVCSGSWFGTVSTDWNNASNWCNGIPTATSDVAIPAGVTNMPVLSSGVGTVRNITIQPGATLTVSATLQIAGTISNSGTFTATNGTIEANGAAAQTIAANTFAGNTITNLKISTTSATSSGALSLTGALSFGNVNSSTFNTSGLLTLKSTATGTARIADITNNGINTGNSIAGLVTVERYITSAGNRAYRLMAPSVTTSSTIRTNWQENGTTPSGYGTHITGSTTGANGFDQTQTGQPSLYNYNAATPAWVAIANTNTLTLNAKTSDLSLHKRRQNN